ncbi:MAG: MFS transporter [Actinomycetes bacterium]
MSPTFASLKVFNYRLWAMGALVSNTGTWMQRVAQDWLVLTQLTANSGIAVGVTTGLQFGPMLFLGPVAGVLADRLPRRRLLMATQGLMGVWGVLLGVLVVMDVVRLWHVFLLALLQGCTAAIDAPARQTFVADMVPADKLSNAVGLNSASFHLGRMIGPALAGLLISGAGTGPVFLINGVTFVATVFSLTQMRLRELNVIPRAERAKGQIREGLRYVRGRPDIVLIMVIIGLVGTFGMNFQMTTALMARVEFHKGAGEYGLLGSVMAIGSLAGALLAARREKPRLRLVVGATAAFGVFAVVAAFMPTYELFAVALIPVGLSSLTLMTAANSTVQTTTDPAMRGRVMALYMTIFMGGTPLGAPVVGWIGETFGAPWSIAVGGIVALPAALAATWYVARRNDVKVRYRLHARPHLLVQVQPLQTVDSGATAAASEAERREDARRKLAARQAQDTASAA